MTLAQRIEPPLLAFAASAVLAAPATAQTNSAPAAAVATPAGNVVRGRAAFMTFGWYECHGTLGQGNFATAPRLTPNPQPYAGIIAYARQPRTNMPSYSAAILPDSVVADIYAYRSRSRPASLRVRSRCWPEPPSNRNSGVNP